MGADLSAPLEEAPPLDSVISEYPEKLYLHYEEPTDKSLHYTLKITLPKKWAGATLDQLRDYFIKHYNEKQVSSTLNSSEMHLERDGQSLRGDVTIATSLQTRDDIYLVSGRPLYKYSKDDTSNNIQKKKEEGLLKCRNFGCKVKKFLPSENHDSACNFHSLPPTFHDTKKGWTCCSDKLVYDWDDFENIKPCTTGRHNEIDPKDRKTAEASNATVAVKEVLPKPGAAAAALSTADAPKSISDYNAANPNAVTAVSAAKAAVKKKPARTDGKAKCKNFGCQKLFVVEDNTDTSCVHHTGPPVFHDSGKYWSCCPKKVKYDFDEFLAVPGCATSAHVPKT